VLAIFALGRGSFPLDYRDVVAALRAGPDAMGPHAQIIWSLRLPRVAAAILAGAGLALAGTVMQTLLRNPLASPLTLGISQGAAFGATCAIVFFGA